MAVSGVPGAGSDGAHQSHSVVPDPGRRHERQRDRVRSRLLRRLCRCRGALNHIFHPARRLRPDNQTGSVQEGVRAAGATDGRDVRRQATRAQRDPRDHRDLGQSDPGNQRDLLVHASQLARDQ